MHSTREERRTLPMLALAWNDYPSLLLNETTGQFYKELFAMVIIYHKT
jgi:hypothetical protein